MYEVEGICTKCEPVYTISVLRLFHLCCPSRTFYSGHQPIITTKSARSEITERENSKLLKGAISVISPHSWSVVIMFSTNAIMVVAVLVLSSQIVVDRRGSPSMHGLVVWAGAVWFSFERILEQNDESNYDTGEFHLKI